MKKTFKNMCYFLKIYFKYAKRWFFVVALSCLVPPLSAYLDIILLRDTVDAIGQGKAFGEIVGKVLLLLGIYLAGNLFEQVVELYFGETVNVRVANRVNQDIYEKVLKTDYKYFDEPEFYDNYTWTLGRFYQQTFSAVQLIWRFLYMGGVVVTVSAVMASMNVVTILFVAAAVALSFLFNWKSNQVIYQKNCEVQPYQRRLNYIQNIFYRREHSLGLKATNIGNVFINQYEKSSGENVGVLKKYRGKITLLSAANVLVGLSMKGGVLIYLVHCMGKGEITVGTFTALFYASENLKNSLESFLNFVTQMQNLDLYTEKIRKFFGMASDIEESALSAMQVPAEPMQIEFRNVGFGYTGKEEPVLQKLNFSIKAGEHVALVGENGAGKSTVTKLLLRLYDVSEGEIRINGAPITKCKLDELRGNIGIAFQDSMIYAMSVRENMRVYDQKTADAKLTELCEKLGLDEVLVKNGGNLDSEMTREFFGEGLELSAGESQLLAVSRVFIKKFGLLILDEPSASLDPNREYRLNQFLLKEAENATVIFISHRLSAAKNMDHILFLENGQIAEEGTHEELMQRKGRYCEMFSKQAEGYVE